MVFTPRSRISHIQTFCIVELSDSVLPPPPITFFTYIQAVSSNIAEKSNYFIAAVKILSIIKDTVYKTISSLGNF